MIHNQVYFKLVWIIYLLCLFLTQSCVIDEPLESEQGGTEIEGPICGSLEGPHQDQDAAIQYGFGRPFRVSEYTGTQDSPLDLLMEYGLQGGHHVDLSLRFTGMLDPDLVDISIDLNVDGPLADLYYGRHETRAWYLLYPQDTEAEGCYFHRARIFLFDLEGQAVEPLGVEMLDGLYATIEIKLSSADADYEWRAHGILHSSLMAP